MKTNLDVDDMAPLEPGCPHCGAIPGFDRHPSSSRPSAPLSRPSALVVESSENAETMKMVTVKKVKKTEMIPELKLPNGPFAYELFVTLVGNKEVAVPWEKLTGNAQKVWTGVARGLERRTIDMLLLQRARHERDSKRG
jgi:hypothetical protein